MKRKLGGKLLRRVPWKDLLNILAKPLKITIEGAHVLQSRML